MFYRQANYRKIEWWFIQHILFLFLKNVWWVGAECIKNLAEHHRVQFSLSTQDSSHHKSNNPVLFLFPQQISPYSSTNLPQRNLTISVPPYKCDWIYLRRSKDTTGINIHTHTSQSHASSESSHLLSQQKKALFSGKKVFFSPQPVIS